MSSTPKYLISNDDFGGQAGGWNALLCVWSLIGHIFAHSDETHNGSLNINVSP